jgi:hypothetical protein
MLRIRKALVGAARLTLVLFVLASLAQAAEYVRPGSGPQADGDASWVTPRAAVFKVKGRAKGLYPGRTRKMRVTVTNLTAFPIVVKRVVAAVRPPGDGCKPKNVGVKPWRGRLRVGAHGHRRMKMIVRMKPRTPDACQGKRFRLRFTGTAVRP